MLNFYHFNSFPMLFLELQKKNHFSVVRMTFFPRIRSIPASFIRVATIVDRSEQITNCQVAVHLHSNRDTTCDVLFQFEYVRRRISIIFFYCSICVCVCVLIVRLLVQYECVAFMHRLLDHIVRTLWMEKIVQSFEQFTLLHKGKRKIQKISQWSKENCFSFVPEDFLICVCVEKWHRESDDEKKKWSNDMRRIEKRDHNGLCALALEQLLYKCHCVLLHQIFEMFRYSMSFICCRIYTLVSSWFCMLLCI